MRSGVATLRAFVDAPAALVEHCELCGAALPEEHGHLFDTHDGRLRCACRPCELLFPERDDARLRPVTPRAERIADIQLDDAQWQALGIPVGLAAVFRSSADGRWRVQMPGALGPVEARSDNDAIAALRKACPTLDGFAADLDVLLLRRQPGEHDAWRVSADRYAHLCGILRSQWRGMGGGQEVQQAIASFFEDLDDRSRSH